MVFSDIDHFKVVNDTYGHQVGDRTLIEYVQCIMSGIRLDLDWLCRYGGEEFILILPETDLDGALILTERLKNNIQQIEIKIHSDVLKITSSFGVVTYDPKISGKAISAENLINIADKYLYQSKNEGRNRITSGTYPKKD